jgi:hypothetical protein
LVYNEDSDDGSINTFTYIVTIVDVCDKLGWIIDPPYENFQVKVNDQCDGNLDAEPNCTQQLFGGYSHDQHSLGLESPDFYRNDICGTGGAGGI